MDGGGYRNHYRPIQTRTPNYYFPRSRKMVSKRELLLVGMLVLALVLPHAGTAATSVNAADATPKWCTGVNIVMFPGGTPGGAFESVVYNGALQATADL